MSAKVDAYPDDVAEDMSDLACAAHGAGQVDGYIRGWEEALDLAGRLVHDNLAERAPDLCGALGIILSASLSAPAWEVARAESARRRERSATGALAAAATPTSPRQPP